MPSSSATRGAPPAPSGRRRPIARISPIPRSVAGFRLAVEGAGVPDRHRPFLGLAAVGRRRERVRRPHQRLRDDPVRPQPRLRSRGVAGAARPGNRDRPPDAARRRGRRPRRSHGRNGACGVLQHRIRGGHRRHPPRPHGQRPGQRSRCSPAPTTGSSTRSSFAPRAVASMPIAPGIPTSMLDNVVVLDYASPTALDYLKAHGDELAAVLVEPVQSRRPELQPREFLQDVRRLTEASGTALVFDELVTGFRTHPGGAQAIFGVRADMATYGKVIGGGLPIGLVAGRHEYLDALDGGAWQYGDDSIPEVGVTFFAGTFVRHPLALAAARAVLDQLEEQGPDLQRDLNLRTTEFASRLEAHARSVGAPVRIGHFSSWLYVDFPSGRSSCRAVPRDDARPRRARLGGTLLVPHDRPHRCGPRARLRRVPGHARRDAGRRSPPGRRRAAGSRSPPGPRRGGSRGVVRARSGRARASTCRSRRPKPPMADGRPALRPVDFDPFAPASERRDPAAAHRAAGRDVDGRRHGRRSQLLVQPVLRADARRPAARRVLARRPRPGRGAARSTARGHRAGRHQPDDRAAVLRVDMPLIDLSDLDPEARRAMQIDAPAGTRVRDAVRPRRGPADPRVRRPRVGRPPPCSSSPRTTSCATAGRRRSCSPISGGSTRPIASASRRSSRLRPRTANTSPAQTSPEQVAAAAADEDYWAAQYPDRRAGARPPAHRAAPRHEDLPQRPRAPADRRAICTPRSSGPGRESGATLFATLLAAYEVLLYRLSGQSDFVVGIPFAGQPRLEDPALVAHCVSTVPLRASLDPATPFAEHLRRPSATDLAERAGPLAPDLRQPGPPAASSPRPRAARRSWRPRSPSTRSARRSTSATSRSPRVDHAQVVRQLRSAGQRRRQRIGLASSSATTTRISSTGARSAAVALALRDPAPWRRGAPR